MDHGYVRRSRLHQSEATREIDLTRGSRHGFSLFDDIDPNRFEWLRAGILRVVDRTFGNANSLSGFDRFRRLPVDRHFKLAFEHIVGFITGMGMTPRGTAGSNLDAHGDSLATGHRYVAPLHHRALDTTLRKKQSHRHRKKYRTSAD